MGISCQQVTSIEAAYCSCIHKCRVRAKVKLESRMQPPVAVTTHLDAEKCGNDKQNPTFMAFSDSVEDP